MDIADKIYASAPGLCDWLGNMSLSGQLVLAAVILGAMIFTVVMCQCVKDHYSCSGEAFDPEWMDEKLWEECRRERV